MLLSNLRQRLARDEGGFTLIELLVVLIIIAVLLAIAIPSYLKFRERAEERAAQSNVRAAIPAVEGFYSEKNTYASIDVAAVKAWDQGLKVTKVVATDGGKGFCVESTHNGKADGKALHHYAGPSNGEVASGACPA